MLPNLNQHVKPKGLLSLVFGFFVVIGVYAWFMQTPYFESFKMWAEQNFVTFALFLLLGKIVGIIIPPLPGGLLTLGSIPIIGWWRAYIIDFTGLMIGSSMAYYLGKKYGNRLLSYFFDDKLIKKIEETKIKKNRQIESVFLLRILFGSTVTEIVCYAAGLLKISFKNFFIGTALSHLVIGVPMFYLANNLLEFKNFWISAIMLAIAIPLLWKLKGRYIE